MTLSASTLELPGRLDGISLTLRPGELTAIVGPNGAGKSSLLACLAGLLDGGEVLLDGVSLEDVHPHDRAKAIGFLPQTPEVAWDVTVETLVALGRLPWPGAPGCAAIEAAIAAMDLEHLRARRVSRLSGGERARALLARVLAGEPRWLLADEPLANLDLAHAAALMGKLRGQAKEGRGVVVVLHDLAAAMNHADRVVVLAEGVVAADGTPVAALTPDLIGAVWKVSACWLGEPGAKALSI
jgi:iron complex transport system ATP-binding protein